MKTFKLPAILAAAGLALSGCNSVPGGGILPPNVQAIVTDAQNLCGFLPTAESVLSILGAFVPGVDTAESIAGAICQAVAVIPKGAAMVGGQRHAYVQLHGQRFVVSGTYAR
jgi:hypothetical protein